MAASNALIPVVVAAVLVVLVLGTPATAAASGPRRMLHQSLTYIPSSSCSGLTTQITAQTNGATISGTITLTNGAYGPINIDHVTVQLNNNVPVAPMFVTANCAGDTQVPANPVEGAVGSITCIFSQPLPASGPAANSAAWTQAMATVTLADGVTTCRSATTNIMPLLMGRRLAA